MLSGARAAGLPGRPAPPGPADAVRLAWPALRLLGERAPSLYAVLLTAGETPARSAFERTPGHRRRAGALGAEPLRDFSGEGTVSAGHLAGQTELRPSGAYTDPAPGPAGHDAGRAGAARSRGWPRYCCTPGLSKSQARCSPRGAGGVRDHTCRARTGGTASSAWRGLHGRHPARRGSAGSRSRGLAREYAARAYARPGRRAQPRTLIRRWRRPASVRSGSCPLGGARREQALIGAARTHMPESADSSATTTSTLEPALSLYPSAGEVGIRPLPDVGGDQRPTFSGGARGPALSR